MPRERRKKQVQNLADATRIEPKSSPTLAAALPAFQTHRCSHAHHITRTLGMQVPPSQRPPGLAFLVLLLPLPSGLSFCKVEPGYAVLVLGHHSV